MKPDFKAKQAIANGGELVTNNKPASCFYGKNFKPPSIATFNLLREVAFLDRIGLI